MLGELDSNEYSRYRWIVLGVAWLATVSLFITHNIPAGRPHDLIPDLGLSQVQYSLTITGPILGIALAAMLGGALADRYGARPIVGIGAILGGLGALFRTFVGNFGPMFGLSIILGIGTALVFSNLPKIVAMWFPPKQIGMATGFYYTGIGVGTATGLAASGAFATWQQACLITGIAALVAAALWTILGRSAPATMLGSELSVGLRQSLRHSVRVKDIWILFIVLFLSLGAILSYLSSLPVMLQQIHHVPPRTAALFSSVVVYAMVCGQFFLPMLSDRLGLRKPVVVWSMVLGAVLVFLTWVSAISVVTWILGALGGFFLGYLAVLLTFPVELPGIGPRFAGGAGGIVLTGEHLGGFLFMPWVFTPIAASSPTAGYLVISIAIVIAAIFMIPLHETGTRRG
jgi:NNP family nitrate/nitrite transporter-like MFS transporter